jgi:hypothetical protein
MTPPPSYRLDPVFDCELLWIAEEALIGLGRIVALHYRSSASYHTH